MIITSNWPFEQWTNFLPDVTAASAILDRFLSRIRDNSRYSEAPVIPTSGLREVARASGFGIIMDQPRSASVRPVLGTVLASPTKA